ncbi:ABC transporter ATP-binding protein/permease [Streptomyces canus]|uniref:ABC transporter ATP-binding protein n=1 Tax=Streptomyces canus TaxID=58343 RepID=UPI002E2DCF0D|nr:ABC transporter ATP-binding protein [Streptomyces canus]
MRNLAHTARWLFMLAWRTDRRRLLKASVLVMLGFLATPAVALALRSLTDHVLAGDLTAGVVMAALIAVTLVAELMLGHFGHLYYFEVGEAAEAQVDAELISYANGTPGIEHLDSAEFADAVVLVREEIQKLRNYLEALLQLTALLVQLMVTTVIMASLQPWLLLLPLGALPPVLAGRYGHRFVERSRRSSAEQLRLARHLLHVATSTGSAKEARISGVHDALLSRHDRSWSLASRQLWRGRLAGASVRALGQITFTLSCCAGIYLVLRQAVRGEAGIGDVVLIVTMAVQLNVQVASALGMLSLLQSAGHMLQRLELLSAWPTRTSPSRPASRSVPPRLVRGIRLEGVGFTYPGTDRNVLDDVTLDLPAGKTIALVGENGAGKSTLVKLLCGLYEPTRGRILADGVDIRDMPRREWQARVSTLFQDFAKLEYTLRENVGVGDLDRMDEDLTLLDGLQRAGADALVKRVPGGLDGPLGRGYTDGADLSGGQWQSLGLARATLREEPLLQVLDEPAAALDAAAEHAVFERYAGSARQVGSRGGVTLFVSHRFSTVRMADRIVVLRDGTVSEVGSHTELMTEEGLYAELFALQARSYR